MTTVLFSEVAPDPAIELIERAGRIYREQGCDGIVGLGGGLWVGQLFMKAGRPFMYVPETVAGAVISLLIAGLVGGALSIRRITAVDPIIALGRDR